MGNALSKKKKKSRKNNGKRQPPPPRIDIPQDNEHSVNTARSVNSILVTSSNHRKHPMNSANNTGAELSQLNPDQTNEDTIQNDPFKGKVEHPQQHKLLAQSDYWPPKNKEGLEVDVDQQNQLTVSSVNQLTVNSVSSFQGGLAQIDDYINRLLDAGYTSKVPKQLCLKSSEVTFICRTAMDIFLGQPVSILCDKLYVCSSLFFFFSLSSLYSNSLHLSKSLVTHMDNTPICYDCSKWVAFLLPLIIYF